MAIRQKVSDILDLPIRSGRWITYAQALDVQGAFSRKVMLDIMMTVCEEIEILEYTIDRLKTQIDATLETNNSLTLPKIELPVEIPESQQIMQDTVDQPIIEDIMPLETNNSLTCTKCGKTLKNQFGLRGHMKSHATT